MIDIVVMAHPRREHDAIDLATTLDAAICWDRHNNEWDTAARAWAMIDPEADWGIVLQDDAQPVPNFRRHAEAALDVVPHGIVSFYVGTGRPRANAVNAAVTKADANDASWITAKVLLWGVGIALPTNVIHDMLDWADTCHLPYDQLLSAWNRTRNLDVRYTWPSLVDHTDGPGLVKHTRPAITRRAHHAAEPTRWTGPTVEL